MIHLWWKRLPLLGKDELVYSPNKSNGELFVLSFKKILLKKPLAKDEKSNSHIPFNNLLLRQKINFK